MSCPYPSHKAYIERLKKIEGQVRGIIRMIDEERYCVDILSQFKAAKAALVKVEGEVLRKHIDSCVRSAFDIGTEKERNKKTEELVKLISRM